MKNTTIVNRLIEQGFKDKSILLSEEESHIEPDKFNQRITPSGWDLYSFEKTYESKGLKLTLNVREHQKLGINLTFTSLPYDSIYTFSTGKPVDLNTAVNIVNDYLESIDIVLKTKN
jgi:hypothetical protein